MDKDYDAFQVFEQLQKNSDKDPYYEIEYDAGPLPGVGKFVLKSDRIEPPQKDEIRELFGRMRDIARENRSFHFSASKFYDKRTQQESSRIFYRQGMFMKDFEDDYGKAVPYSSYFPNYQMMGYDQLRTYFTWRTLVRQGKIEQVSLSYAFLYIYELLNNIGVESPEEGLDRLLLFWDAFRVYDKSLDKYVPKWLKDYHIYYPLPQTFREFIVKNGLEAFYPGLSDPEDRFDLYCAISKYDIRKSRFYTEENSGLIKDCFYFVIGRLEQVFAGSRIDLEDYIFQPTKSMAPWTPFQGALFYPALRQEDRKIVLSKKEIYICSQNRWTFSAVITTESGKQLTGYAMKQMEAVLRKLTGYKYKLSANEKSLSPVMAEELSRAGISLETAVTGAVREFYREATRTVVTVDPGALEKIRREALATQEKLIVPEEEPLSLLCCQTPERAAPRGIETQSAGGMQESSADERPIAPLVRASKPQASESQTSEPQASESQISEPQASEPRASEPRASKSQASESQASEPWVPEIQASDSQTSEASAAEGCPPDRTGLIDPADGCPEGQIRPSGGEQEPYFPGEEWRELWSTLTETERGALRILSEESGGLKEYADGQGVMLEVLADGINEKAMDFIGDSLLDEEYVIYTDYIEQVKEMVEIL